MATVVSNQIDDIEFEQDYEGMLRRALERIIQLYTDKSHFIYELLQNAEDAGAKNVKFVQKADSLELLHDGKPFTKQNLQSLCDIGLSDKTQDLNQIGEFGVGFKSVFGICETVRLYSEPKNYRGEPIPGTIRFSKEILDFVKPQNIPFEPMPMGFTTRFVFPYTAGKSFSGFNTIQDLTTVVSKKLQNLGITTLLFMKSLESIEYKIELGGAYLEGQYLLEKKVLNDHCALVSALGVSNVHSGVDNGDNIISYLKFSRRVDDVSTRTIDIAFPVKVKDDGSYECVKSTEPYISVYFPTQRESKLGFVVQGPFRTTPNRENIPEDDPDNIRLAQQTASLLKDALLELRDAGKLNMSFVKSLPLSARPFDNYGLFLPMYETVKTLFSSNEKIIPTHDGGYTSARTAKIARPERLATLFSDDLLTSLHVDGYHYKWLPTFLTDTNTEYEAVYRYLTTDLKITVIRPENLRIYFASNPRFLPQRNNDWLVELYSVYENVAAAFSKNKNETNTLTCDIVKTTTGKFVAPYRKTENKQLIPNVFLYVDGIDDPDIHFVDIDLYERARDFFDNILQIQKPNEYEFFIKDIKRRYDENYEFDEEKHIDDFKKLIKYHHREEYREEILRIIRENFLVKCNDGTMRSPYMSSIYLSVSPEGIEIENYLRNVASGVSFVDSEFYLSHGVDIELLSVVGIRTSILTNQNVRTGQYTTGKPGKQPDWWTTGEFRWKLSLEYIKDVVRYISAHPTAKDSLAKSYAIFHTLLLNEDKLCGTLHIGGAVPNRENETCELIKILRGETVIGWDGKWLYAGEGELVSPRMVSRHEISPKYNKSNIDSKVYELLGFKKTELDEVVEIKKSIPRDKLDVLLEHELKTRFGITLKDIEDGFGGTDDPDDPDEPEEKYEFPTARVKNWDTLRKHAAEMLCFADPVKYDYAVRKIRVSNKPKEARAYLFNLYRYTGIYKYACQMCHDSCSNVEAVELFYKPETELDPMHLCLCPNCAAKYKELRNHKNTMEELLSDILSKRESDMGGDYVALTVEDSELWFTHVHFAEIQELLRLTKEAQNVGKATVEPTSPDEPDETSGLDVYQSFVGKKLRRSGGFEAEVLAVNKDKSGKDIYLHCQVLAGEKKGLTTDIQLSFVLANPNVYKIV